MCANVATLQVKEILSCCVTFDDFAFVFSAPPLKLIDLPGLEQRIVDESMVSCVVFKVGVWG